MPTPTAPNLTVPAVVVERLINATPERLWSALTRAEEIERWFFTEARTDARRGGDYEIFWRSAKDASRDHRRCGRYLEFDPPRKLVFEWRGDSGGCHNLDGAGETTVAITLTPEGKGTRLTLVHSGWSTTDAGRTAADSHRGGWTFYVENLEHFVEGKPDERTARIDQRTKPA